MKFSPIIVFVIFLFSCQPVQKSTTNNAENQQIVDNSSEIVEKRGDMTITKIKPTEGDAAKNVGEIIGIYFSATFYTGSTDYFFKDPKGKTFQFRQSNFEEDQTFKLPEGMLEEVSEGLPGANPAMIGKRFRINFGKDGEPTAVQLLN